MCICIHTMLEMRLSDEYLNAILVILMLDLAAPQLLLLLWLSYKLSQLILKLIEDVLKRNVNVLPSAVAENESEDNQIFTL